MKNKAIYIILGVIVFLGIILGATYNSLNSQSQNVKAKWSQVENVMQRRADLVPNLVSSVQGSMKNEQKIFGDIADARKSYNTATTDNDKLAANDQLQSATNVLVNAVAENYPELKSNENVKTLMSQLEGSENRISVERREYINAVQSYNTKIHSFPTNIFAGMFNFKEVPEYKADEKALTTPSVSFEFDK